MLAAQSWLGALATCWHAAPAYHAMLRQLHCAGSQALWQVTSFQTHSTNHSCSCRRYQHTLGSATAEEALAREYQHDIGTSTSPGYAGAAHRHWRSSDSPSPSTSSSSSSSSSIGSITGAASPSQSSSTSGSSTHSPPAAGHEAAAESLLQHGSSHGSSSSKGSHSSSASSPGGYLAARASLRQVPDAPGTPTRPLHAPHIAARHHLQQYLASIERMGFVDDLAAGISAGNRLAISRGLTLCESTRPDHALQAAALLRRLIDHQQQQLCQPGHVGTSSSSSRGHEAVGQPDVMGHQQPPASTLFQQLAAAAPQPHPALHPGPAAEADAAAAALGSSGSSRGHVRSLRVGLSGPPGAGKSSLIETWGCYLADHGSKVAVLAVDPSSVETGGAILGDKTRMARLSSHPNAFVRPSPARGTLGGVSRATYDAMVICEAAGYDKVLVETVGVGQSEVAVADLVDCMLLVMPPVGGDDLQMIKRGIMEVADVVLVNKADGATEAAATRAAAEYGGCLHLMPHRYHGWSPQVLAVSAYTGKGVPALARLVAHFQQALTDSGELEKSRIRRAESITWLSLEEQLLEGLRQDPHTHALMARLMPCVRAGTMAPRSAADIALSYFYQHCS